MHEWNTFDEGSAALLYGGSGIILSSSSASAPSLLPQAVWFSKSSAMALGDHEDRDKETAAVLRPKEVPIPATKKESSTHLVESEHRIRLDADTVRVSKKRQERDIDEVLRISREMLDVFDGPANNENPDDPGSTCQSPIARR